MGTIIEYRNLFQNSSTKEEKMKIVKKVFEKERMLFDYCKFMENNPCVEICIKENIVYATFNIEGQLIKMSLDAMDMAAVPYTILMQGEYEKKEFDMVMHLLNLCDKNSVVFDVGANLGWYGINIKKRLPSYKIHFFEPVLSTYHRLCENISLNNMGEEVINNIGFSDKTDVVKFFYDVTASGASSMADLREEKTTKQISVNMLTMDEYVHAEGIHRLDFIKCDVEGSEFLVYKGGEETLKKYKPIVFSEILRKWSAKFGYHPNDIIDFLNDIGYQCYICEDEKLVKFDRVNESTIQTNYFFLHKEKHREIIDKLCVEK